MHNSKPNQTSAELIVISKITTTTTTTHDTPALSSSAVVVVPRQVKLSNSAPHSPELQTTILHCHPLKIQFKPQKQRATLVNIHEHCTTNKIRMVISQLVVVQINWKGKLVNNSTDVALLDCPLTKQASMFLLSLSQMCR